MGFDSSKNQCTFDISAAKYKEKVCLFDGSFYSSKTLRCTPDISAVKYQKKFVNLMGFDSSKKTSDCKSLVTGKEVGWKQTSKHRHEKKR